MQQPESDDRGVRKNWTPLHTLGLPRRTGDRLLLRGDFEREKERRGLRLRPRGLRLRPRGLWAGDLSKQHSQKVLVQQIGQRVQAAGRAAGHAKFRRAGAWRHTAGALPHLLPRSRSRAVPASFCTYSTCVQREQGAWTMECTLIAMPAQGAETCIQMQGPAPHIPSGAHRDGAVI